MELADDYTARSALEAELMSLASSMNVAMASWLDSLRTYDRQEGWKEWGCSSVSQWLSWRCGMSIPTAHERVRVAHALPGIPKVRAEFAAGHLSYSKVRALTRVATPDNESDLLSMALNATGAQLDRICAGVGRSDPAKDDPGLALAKRTVRRRDNDDGTTTLTIVMMSDGADQVMSSIETRVDETIGHATADVVNDEHITRHEAIGHFGGIHAMRSDAAVELLSGPFSSSQPVSADLVLVLPDFDSDEAPSFDGRHITDSAADRLSCDPKIRVLIEDALGNPIAVSHESRHIPDRLRRQLIRRDLGRCQFSGCCAKRRLHAHHVVHWARGGPTQLDNLVLVCGFHHHVLHEGGWSFQKTEAGKFALLSPAGESVVTNALNDLAMRVLPPAPDEAVLHPQNYSPLTDLSWITAFVYHNAAVNRRAA